MAATKRPRRGPDPDSADRASDAREAAGLTSRVVGDAIDVSAATVRAAESGRRTLPARAAVMLADVLGLSLAEVSGLAPAEIRLDAGQAHALAREVAVLLGSQWERLRAPDAGGLRVLAAMRWALAGAAPGERGVYVACVPLTSGGRVIVPGEVVPGLEHATAAGIAAEVSSGRVTFVPLALLSTASASPSTSTAAPR